MTKKDCFAYNEEKDECNACKDLKCNECAFYREKQEYLESIKNLRKRISNEQNRDLRNV